MKDPDWFLHKIAAQGILERRLDLQRDLTRVAIFGSRGLLTKSHLRAKTALYLESTSGFFDSATRREDDAACIIAQEDALPFAPSGLDAYVSVLSLHSVNDLPGALIQINRALKADGVMIAALFSSGTLGRLKDAFLSADAVTKKSVSPRFSPLIDVRDGGALLQRAGFQMPVADTDTLTVRYSDMLKLMHDLRAMAETNCLHDRARIWMRRETLAAALADMEQYRDTDGKIPVTFNITYLMGFAPGPNQPRPKAPGSAKSRLADALGTKEISLAGAKKGVKSSR